MDLIAALGTLPREALPSQVWPALTPGSLTAAESAKADALIAQLADMGLNAFHHDDVRCLRSWTSPSQCQCVGRIG